MAVAAKPNESEIIKRQCEVVPERYTNCSGISSSCLRETLSVLCGKLETKRRDRRGFRRGGLSFLLCGFRFSWRLCVKVFQAVAHAKPPRRKAKIGIK